ncbi:MAG: response regulator transcription factor [Salinivirgaceae bacterium]|nr:response regulator transcription factor [Salinivirgaceae bacterium]
MKVVIIEDEPFAQNELTRLLNRVDADIEIIKYIDSVEDAIEWFSNNEHPPLVFLDIQLSDGISFEIFNSVTIHSSIIFTTAYDEYAIRAFKLNSIDYLLKPIDQEALNSSLEKFKSMKDRFQKQATSLNIDQLHNLIQLAGAKSAYKNRLLTKIGDQIRFIKTEDVAYIYAEDNVVLLMNTMGKKSIIDQSLEQLGKVLDPDLFYRINRKYFVNKNAIEKVHKYFNSRLKLELLPKRDEDILISRVKVHEFLDWMGK